MGRGRPYKSNSTVIKNISSQAWARREEAEAIVQTDSDQLERPPKWLIDKNARTEWKRIITELKKMEIIGNLDLNNIGAYCNAYANYRRATDELKESTLTIVGSKGDPVINPLVNIQQKFSDEMRKYASLCGLTMDSRLKAAHKKVETAENNIQSMFGVI